MTQNMTTAYTCDDIVAAIYSTVHQEISAVVRTSKELLKRRESGRDIPDYCQQRWKDKDM